MSVSREAFIQYGDYPQEPKNVTHKSAFIENYRTMMSPRSWALIHPCQKRSLKSVCFPHDVRGGELEDEWHQYVLDVLRKTYG